MRETTMHHNEIAWEIFTKAVELTGHHVYPSPRFLITENSPGYLGLDGRVYEVVHAHIPCTPEPTGAIRNEMVFYRLKGDKQYPCQFCCDTTFRSMFRPLIHDDRGK
jgi:hypothetical protein